LRRTVQQASTQLLLEPADLAAEGGLRDAEVIRGATEMPMIGDRDEVPHQPQVEVRRGRLRVGHGLSVADGYELLSCLICIALRNGYWTRRAPG
jgi:hypothetical protein